MRENGVELTISGDKASYVALCRHCEVTIDHLHFIQVSVTPFACWQVDLFSGT